MSIVKRHLAADEATYKNAYVTVFQTWTKGTINGTAEQISEAKNPFLRNRESACYTGAR